MAKNSSTAADLETNDPVELRRQIEDLKTVLANQSAELEKIRTDEAEFRSLFNESMEGIVLMYLERKETVINTAACRMLGISKEDIREMGHEEYIDTNDPRFKAAWTTLNETGKYQGELIFVRKDGSSFPVEINIHILPDVHHRQFLHMVFRDVSQRVDGEQTIKDERLKLQQVFNLLPTGISVLDANGNIIAHNPALEKILGITPSGLGARAYTGRKYIKPDGSPALPEYFPSNRVLAGEALVENVVIGVIKEDGSCVWAEVSAAASSLPDWKVILSTTDITERVLAEQLLVDNETKYRALFENSLYAVALVDMKDNTIIDVNNSFTRLFGFNQDEVAGKMSVFNFTGEPDKTSISIHDLSARGSLSIPVRKLVKKNGSSFYASISSSVYTWKGRLFGIAMIDDITPRVEAEIALRESEEKYRVVFNNEIYAICIYDLDTYRFLDVNEAFSSLYGYSREELLGGMSIMDVSAEPEKSVNATKSADSSGSMFIPLRFHRKKDGTVFPVENIGGPYTWKGQRVMFAMIHDITERRQVDESLRESEEKYRVLFNNDIYAACIYDPNTLAFLDANDAFLRLYGYTRDELVSKTRLPELSAEPDKSVETVAQSINEGQYIVPLRMHRKKNGTIFPVESVGQLYTWNKKQVMFRLIHDITPRIEAEKNIRFQASLLENAGEAVTAMDMQGRILYLNQAAEKMFGLKEKDVLGKPNSEVIPTIPSSVDRNEIAVQLRSAQNIRAEAQMIGGNGETIDVAITFNLVSPEGMEEPYVITIIQDITERKRLQEQVIEARKMASIGTLAAGLAHELNSPLQVITGTCETTLNRLQDGRMSLEQARAKVETINRSAWNCAAILRMLLEVAGPTADTFTAEDINDLIDEAIPLLLRLNSPARQYSTQTWPGRDLPRLVCKRGKILQLLNILLQNAADAMPDGGKVTIRSGYQPLSDEVWVQINDRGPGVPAELRKRIFEPFFTTRPQGQGRGLGLFILHNTLKAMDGYVTINDAESGGAAFTISLPVNASQVASRQTAQPGRYDLNNNTG